MSPEQTFQFGLTFASGANPLWLGLLLPVVLLLAYWLYRREIGAMGTRKRRTLYALRLVLVAAACIGLFMPELGIVRNLLYRGRIVFLLDNSESMLAHDSSLPVPDALDMARALRDERQGGEPPAPAESFFRFSRRIQEAVDGLREYQRDLARIGRDHPDMARNTQQLQDRATLIFAAIGEEAKRLPLDRLPPELREGNDGAWLDGAALRREWDTLFAGGTPASQEAGRLCGTFEDAIAACRAFQREIDRQELEAGGEPLRKAAAAIMARQRLDLVRDQLNRALPAIRQWTPGQYVQVADLMGGETRLLEKNESIAGLTPRRGRTDILSRLEAIVEESPDFPLSAVVLASDGVDWSTRDPDPLLKACVRKRIPLLCLGAGHVEEPFDMAIEQLSVAPIGVQGKPVSVEVHIKAAVPLPASCTLAILSEGRELQSGAVELRHPHQIAYLSLTPAATGLQRFEVELRAAGPDQFKDRNNRSEFVVDVRDRPVRVLLLDDRPRWQTRFALNILSRLPYVDLNGIVRVSLPDGALKRGPDQGMWPDSAAALDIYDLIVLGRFDQAVLTAEEWDQVASFVVDRGKAVAFLAPGDLRGIPEKLRRLLPVADTGAPSAVSTGDALSALRVTPEGALHPLTRGLGGALAAQPFPGGRLAPESFALLQKSDDGRPVVSGRYAGKGRVFLLEDERLWKSLNQDHLAAHGAVFIHLVDWSLRSFSEGIAVEQNVMREGDSFQVGFSKPAAQAVLLDGRGGEAARAAAAPSPSSRGLFRAVLAPPAPGVYRLRADPAGKLFPIFVLPDNAELTRLAMDPGTLRRLAAVSGGECRTLADAERCFPGLPLKERREVHRTVFPLWSSRVVLLSLLLLLSLEWILRKVWRLV